MAKPKIDKNVQIPEQILRELLTPSEARMLKNRWQIIHLLEDGLSIRKVATQVKVGTDTVVRVARMIEKGSLRKLLDEERGQNRKFKTKTPWIFGKVE
ncbi:helix-turn-helix domain-containing protein [Candidatus Daviesbacteria bacterium]|nr:helix-turn-helix domain-containing protein [Candidatus Daviesbacteria bacterium]